jgi:formamidopyrimidine-DNA glycosylase
LPELPEVETVRRGLERQTRLMAIGRVEVLRSSAIAYPADPALFRFALEGSRIGGWGRRGKYLLARLEHADGSDAGLWGVHLRMTGQFLWLAQSPSNGNSSQQQDPTPTPEEAIGRHTRVRLWSDQGDELRFLDTRSFGRMWWVPPGSPPEAVITGLARLGPEPFDPLFNGAYLRKRLRQSERAIKTALLDQALVAGVGNIYADESLFAAGIRPHTPCRRLSQSQLENLHHSLVQVLHTSIGAGGTTFSDFRDLTGTNGNYGGEAWVYRRTGLPCRRCGNPIQRHRLGGRSTHWCPTCQP